MLAKLCVYFAVMNPKSKVACFIEESKNAELHHTTMGRLLLICKVTLFTDTLLKIITVVINVMKLASNLLSVKIYVL